MANTKADFETLQWRFDSESGIGTVVLDRPESLNAMSTQMLDELSSAVEQFEAIDKDEEGVSVRAVIVEGAGERAFSSGVDVNEIGDESYPHTASAFRETFFTVEEYGAPVIAKIDGYCVGGGLELALLCDFRIASERSELGFPEIDLGIFPSAVGTTQRLPLLVGPSRAKELFMTGEFLSGMEAFDEGLLNQVHSAAELDENVREYAEMLAGKPPLAVRAIKDTVNRSQEMGLQQGVEYEYQAYLPLLQTEDYAEGAAAFEEDRNPKWEGR
jgi:enoyl-CoA hydratase/carnithine racemase